MENNTNLKKHNINKKYYHMRSIHQIAHRST